MIFKQSFQQDYNKENNSTTLKLLTEQIIDNKNISYQTQELDNSDYDFYNLQKNATYKLMSIPSGSNFQSNNTCVSYPELINYNNTISFKTFQYRGKVFPENFCFGLLTYNISRNDFFDIVEKNKSKKFFEYN